MKTRLALCAGFGLGISAMYIFDADNGRRRRALLRDRFVHVAKVASRTISGLTQGVTNRTRGLISETGSRFSRAEVSDEVLTERVRSEMGHATHHANAVEVMAHHGHITLSGSIPADEADSLLARVASVRGVAGIENHLVLYEHEPDGSAHHDKVTH
jgi:osmotically-inducible protein OsmY